MTMSDAEAATDDRFDALRNPAACEKPTREGRPWVERRHFGVSGANA